MGHDDGNIRTVRLIDVKTAQGSFIKIHEYIAFNLGENVTPHIVSLHNAPLQK